jgi:hypothetical protein
MTVVIRTSHSSATPFRFYGATGYILRPTAYELLHAGGEGQCVVGALMGEDQHDAVAI